MIEVNGVIYRNLEEQVQKNKEDIENLQNQQSGDDSDIEQIDNRLTEVETTLTEITPDVMRALKTPISAPSETKIVAVDSTNSQEMLSVGTGLVIENHQLKSTGGTEIIDNLTSSSTTAGLSANQGRVLDNKITTLSQTVNSKANQSSLDLTNQNVSQNTSNISTINSQISNIDSQTSTNTENIEFLQSDIAGKTNVTINNVHQDYVNFSSDPQTQLNTLETTKLNKEILKSTLIYETKLLSEQSSVTINNFTINNNEILCYDITTGVISGTEADLCVQVGDDSLASNYNTYGIANPNIDTGYNLNYWKAGYFKSGRFQGHGEIMVNDGDATILCKGVTSSYNDGSFRSFGGSCNLTGTTITQIKFYLTSNNIPAGTFIKIYKKLKAV